MKPSVKLRFAFEGRVVFLTGAASGMGRAMAKLLAACGARVHAADRDGEGLASLAKETGGPGSLHTHLFDVTDSAAWLRELDEAERTDGAIDYLFNNAGVTLVGAAHTIPFERWKWLLDINVMGTVNGTQIVYPRMAARRAGHIVNTASIAGVTGYASASAYTASKGVVIELTRSTGAEAREYGVKFSLVCPGYVDTNIFTQDRVVGTDVGRMLGDLPIRMMSSERAAAAILAGVARGREVIVFPLSSQLLWHVSHWAPALLGPFQRHLMRLFT